MNVTEAIKIAKDWVRNVYEEEQIMDVGLEEIRPDHAGGFRVTIGFTRPWQISSGVLFGLQAAPGKKNRSLKIVTVDGNGQVMDMENRDVS